MPSLPRPQEELRERLVIAVRALADDGDGGHLERVHFNPPERSALEPLPTTEKVAILQRDSFTCRYCGIRQIFLPVLRALSEGYPDRFPVDSGWTTHGTHPAYNLLSATFDHVIPPDKGGKSDPETIVTACWPCNSGKSNYSIEQVGFKLRPPSHSGWDGLSKIYPQLCKLLSIDSRRYHQDWLKALHPDFKGRRSSELGTERRTG